MSVESFEILELTEETKKRKEAHLVPIFWHLNFGETTDKESNDEKAVG